MANNFHVDVVGIDLSINMVSFALERAIGLNCSVEFEVADCTKKTYPENSFDVIYSRDTILHIQVRRLFFLLLKFFFFWRGVRWGVPVTWTVISIVYVFIYIIIYFISYFLMDNVEQLYTHCLKFECLLVNFLGQTCIIQILLQVVEAWRQSSYQWLLQECWNSISGICWIY